MKATLLGLFGLVLVSCSGHDSVNPLVGKWLISFEQQSKKVHLTIDFFKDHRFFTDAFDGPVHITVEGNYFLRGDTFIIRDQIQKPVPICSLMDSGSYIYSLREDTLTFKTITDKCEKRKFVLMAGLVRSK